MATWLGPLASWIGALVAFYGVYKSKVLNDANNTQAATLEAQKLLLEINKIYIAEPSLLVLEGEKVEVPNNETNFQARLRAVAYLKLNVFEIIFVTLRDEDVLEAWTTYFEESVAKSEILRAELDTDPRMYHKKLMKAYRKWQGK